MKINVGKHVLPSFANANGEENLGGEAKSELVDAIFEIIPGAMTKILNYS